MNGIRMHLLAALLASAFVAPVALAEDAHHPDPAKGGAAIGPVAAATALPAPAVAASRMKENLKRMEAQLDRIAKAKDASERARLLAEHMNSMRQNMGMAQAMMQAEGGAMMGPGMMGGMMGHGMMGGQGGAMMGHGVMGGAAGCPGMGGGMAMMGSAGAMEPMMMRMMQMENRLDRMQAMIEGMSRGQPPQPAK